MAKRRNSDMDKRAKAAASLNAEDTEMGEDGQPKIPEAIENLHNFSKRPTIVPCAKWEDQLGLGETQQEKLQDLQEVEDCQLRLAELKKLKMAQAKAYIAWLPQKKDWEAFIESEQETRRLSDIPTEDLEKLQPHTIKYLQAQEKVNNFKKLGITR